MIERYSLKEMSQVWSLENRFDKMLQVERAVAQAQGELGLIPKEAARAIQKVNFKLKNILEREKTTRHDVTAFVQELAASIGEKQGAYVHYGLTSSDVLDTGFSLQLRQAQRVLNPVIKQVKEHLKHLIQKHKSALCSGRTHGMHAEPLSFGYKLLGYLAELQRAEQTFQTAMNQTILGKFSGAVGVYAVLSPELEERVCEALGLQAEQVATQVIPRDRHARILFALNLFGVFWERLALELRHLQRTEVGEVSEGFFKGQTGSSAMPHKKNPISSENLTGLARLLRSYLSPSLENVSLWHERDISHSSVERVIFPDAFTLAHYALNRLVEILKNLQVNQERMKQNMNLSQGLQFSSRVLTVLVSRGLPRSEAYPLVQKISHSLKPGESFENLLKQNAQIKKYLTAQELSDIFSGKEYSAALEKRIDWVLKELDKNP
ncbi:MAG: adenylosuccinate lyase [Bdellovibrionales bacterium]|nr:adenylosuccinate lyase [Bdellovibrionales bacterium]